MLFWAADCAPEDLKGRIMGAGKEPNLYINIFKKFNILRHQGHTNQKCFEILSTAIRMAEVNNTSDGSCC